MPLLRLLHDKLVAPVAKAVPKTAKTWIISPVSQSPQQVLASLKELGFAGKIIFAGLAPFERVENNIKQFLTASGWDIDVHALLSRDARTSSAVYIQQSDLAPAQAIACRDFLSAWV